MSKLSEEQIKQKLVEGHNYKRLYSELKDKYDAVVLENKQLKQELLDQRQYFESIIEKQAAQISELQAMVFGCKKQPRSGGGHVAPKQSRDTTSYHRDTPKEDEITSEEHYSITTWHSVAVKQGESFSLMKRSDAEALGGQVVLINGRPSYYSVS
jgi:hypothetical protein